MIDEEGKRKEGESLNMYKSAQATPVGASATDSMTLNSNTVDG